MNPDETVEICGICGQRKKRLVLLNSTVQYCECEDKVIKDPVQTRGIDPEQLDLFDDPFDWSDLNKPQ